MRSLIDFNNEDGLSVLTNYPTGIQDSVGRVNFAMFKSNSRAFRYNTIPRVGFTLALVRRRPGQGNHDNYEV